MTFEEMQEIARKVASQLQKAGWEASYLDEDGKPGEPLLIGLSGDDGEFTLALDVA